jgi:hypothetical protein
VIEVVDAELVKWLSTVVAPAAVMLGPPAAVPDGTGITCHLLALVPTPTARGNRRPPVQAMARYLVTAAAATPLDAHRLLGQVLVAAADRPDLDLEHHEPPVGLWPALGVAPQPAISLRVPVRWPRDEPRAPLVREPLRVEWHEARPVAGVVVSPGGTPVARAEVRLPGVDAPTWTEHDGTFVVPGVPVPSGALPVTVTARGLVRTISVPVPAGTAAPLTVVFDPEE